MKKVTTILKEINELEEELYRNYSYEEINKGFEKLETENYRYSVTGALYMIGTGVADYLTLDAEYPDT